MHSKLKKNICSHITGLLPSIPTESLQINQKHIFKLYVNPLEFLTATTTKKKIKEIIGKLPTKKIK